MTSIPSSSRLKASFADTTQGIPISRARIAAWLVSRVNPALLGTAVGGVILLTNSQKLVHFFGVHWPWSTGIYSVIVVAFPWLATWLPGFM